MDRILTKTLAELYFQQGDLQQAYNIYKSLAEKDPSDQALQTRLKELKEKMGPPPHPPSVERRIQTLKKWLNSIQERKTG